LTKIKVLVFLAEDYIDCLSSNNNRQAILQYNSSNKNTTVDNIKIVADNSGQECVLTESKIISFSNIVDININRASVLINRIL